MIASTQNSKSMETGTRKVLAEFAEVKPRPLGHGTPHSWGMGPASAPKVGIAAQTLALGQAWPEAVQHHSPHKPERYYQPEQC